MPSHVSRALKFVGLGFLIGGLGGAGWYLVQVRGRGPVGDTVTPTRLFEQVLSHVQNFGVDSLGETEIFRRAAEGLVRELDDEYAALIPAGASLDGPNDAGGLGLMVFVRGERTIVQQVLPGSPAEKAGIWAGDEILSVGEVAPTGVGREAVRQTLDGAPGSTVAIDVRRPGVRDTLRFSLRREGPRDHLLSERIDLDGGVAYLSVGLIGPGLVPVLRRTLRDLPPSTRGLVLDLRGSTGGTVEEAAAIADLFLDEGAPIVTVRGRGDVIRHVSAEQGQLKPDLPITVLVDRATADAAEAVAGALQDDDRALILGSPTFGRGSSQGDYPLGDRWTVRISTARWETPLGRRIEPDLGGAPLDSVPERPSFTTGEGRSVLGGGGIVPDSLIDPPELSPAMQALYRILGSAIPNFVVKTHEIAQGLVRRATTPGYLPTDNDLASLMRLLTEEEFRVPPHVAEVAREDLRELLGREAVYARLGLAGLVRRMMASDPGTRMAVELLRNVRTPRELVLGR